MLIQEKQYKDCAEFNMLLFKFLYFWGGKNSCLFILFSDCRYLGPEDLLSQETSELTSATRCNSLSYWHNHHHESKSQTSQHVMLSSWFWPLFGSYFDFLHWNILGLWFVPFISAGSPFKVVPFLHTLRRVINHLTPRYSPASFG